jgi:hypothetical protein
MTTEARMNEPKPRTELGRLAASLGLPMREVPSPPGTAPWEEAASESGDDVAEVTSPDSEPPFNPDPELSDSLRGKYQPLRDLRERYGDEDDRGENRTEATG